MAMESKYIWMNGKMVPFEKATLHFLTPALHYGAAVFEGIRTYNTPKGPAVFRLKEHTERLFDSARVFGFREFPWTVDDVCNAIKQTVKANEMNDCYVRPLLYLDEGGWNLSVDGGKPSLAIAVWIWANYLGEEALEKGIRANIASFTRHHPNVSMTKAKITGNYSNSIPSQDRVDAAGVRRGHHARPARLYRGMHGRESFRGARQQGDLAFDCARFGRHHTRIHLCDCSRSGV